MCAVAGENGFEDARRQESRRPGAEAGPKNACKIVEAGDNQEERPATVAGKGLHGEP